MILKVILVVVIYGILLNYVYYFGQVFGGFLRYFMFFC